MKKHLQLILALLCILALALGITAALAEETEEVRVITIKWEDGDNVEQVRPTGTITATLAGKPADLNEDNGWTGQVTVPASTGNDWVLPAVEKYALAPLDKGPITTATYHYAVAPLISVTGHIVDWGDNHNAKGIRPETVELVLYADGEPYGKPVSCNASATWDNLPSVKPGTNTAIVYTVKPLRDPAGYTSSCSGTDVTFTLNTVDVKIKATVAGTPEGTDLSGLRLVVDGPDPDMPKTLTWADVSGGYTFTGVLPGAYLVRDINADTLVEGYTMDPANSKVCDAAYVATGSATLEWKYTYKEPEAIEDADEDYDPWAGIGSLSFTVLGPDERMPLKLTLADFDKTVENTYEYKKLDNLTPGVYTVVETNAEGLVKYYTLTSDSKTAMKLEVTPGGTATAKLYNQYVPAPTPEPDAEFVDVPVTKTWNDSNDRDGNRPESITVRLYADGVEVNSHVLTAAENWTYTFTELPRYKEDNKTEIVYSVNEDDVAMYSKEIKGYNISNYYLPEVTSKSVAKVWQDNNDEQKIRPTSIAMTLLLKDGETETKVATVILSEENGWSATVNNLPATVNGKPAVYAWKEQEVLGYTLVEAKEQNGVMTFINEPWTRPETPTQGAKPKTRGTQVVTLEDYDTPLGVEVIINHVGDCFD